MSKLFCLMASGGFHHFGRRSVLELPIRIIRGDRIEIGDDVYVGAGSCLQTLGEATGPLLFIGNGTSIAGTAVISAADPYASAIECCWRGTSTSQTTSTRSLTPAFAVLDQGVERIAPVKVGDGAWLGQNVVVGPGVSIGSGAVIGANSVVLDDVPDHAVAVGAPARVVRQLASVPPPASPQAWRDEQRSRSFVSLSAGGRRGGAAQRTARASSAAAWISTGRRHRCRRAFGPLDAAGRLARARCDGRFRDLARRGRGQRSRERAMARA